MDQIVGKTRLAPPEHHWWHIALYLTPRGLTTSPMPHGTRTFAADFDFLDHQLYLRTGDGNTRAVKLASRTVADFTPSTWRRCGPSSWVRIRPVPVEVEVAISSPADREHAAYDAEAVSRWWRMVAHADRVLKPRRGAARLLPVHLRDRRRPRSLGSHSSRSVAAIRVVAS